MRCKASGYVSCMCRLNHNSRLNSRAASETRHLRYGTHEKLYGLHPYISELSRIKTSGSDAGETAAAFRRDSEEHPERVGAPLQIPDGELKGKDFTLSLVSTK